MKQYVEQALSLRKWVSISHHIPGRLRLKYKLGIIAKIAQYKSKELEETLSGITAFKNYKLNPATGSVLIEYDATVIQPDWIAALFSSVDEEATSAYFMISEKIEKES